MGDVLQVSGPITWPHSSIPSAGHYCFVAIAGSANDPAPPLATLTAPTPGNPVPNSWDRFLRFVGANNNVAWRNFFVVSPDPLPESGIRIATFTFRMSAAPDIARPMGLEIVANLPRGSHLGFEAPMAMIDAWGLRSPYLEIAGDNGIVPVNANGRFLVPEHPLSPGTHVPITLRAYIPETFRDHAFTIFARQMYQRLEVGRVTCRLQRPNRSHEANG